METFNDFLETIKNVEHRDRLEEILNWIESKFPKLDKRIAWSQPMFTDHDTFIIGFSVAKHHIAVAPEKAGLRQFSDRITKAGYHASKEIFKIRWEEPVDYKLLEDMISFNIDDKGDCKTFWRK